MSIYNLHLHCYYLSTVYQNEVKIKIRYLHHISLIKIGSSSMNTDLNYSRLLLWCLTPLSTIFQLQCISKAVSVIGEGNGVPGEN